MSCLEFTLIYFDTKFKKTCQTEGTEGYQIAKLSLQLWSIHPQIPNPSSPFQSVTGQLQMFCQ